MYATMYHSLVNFVFSFLLLLLHMPLDGSGSSISLPRESTGHELPSSSTSPAVVAQVQAMTNTASRTDIVSATNNYNSFLDDSNYNSTENNSQEGHGFLPSKALTTGALLRGFYVFLGCSAVVLLYFGLKFVCNRRRQPYRKVARGDEMDMFPLTEEGDEDEEIFSANMGR